MKTKEFLQKSLNIHGDRYGYNFVKYKNSIKKVDIVCKKHGIFRQSPSGHLAGKGCRKCNQVELQRDTQNEFISKAIEVHGDTYLYTKVNYVNSRTPVTITCKIHGDFQLSPNKHTSAKRGCKKCSLRKSAKAFINEAIDVHGNTYSYKNCIYTMHNKKVTVTCKKHGDFDTLPHRHIQEGKGCKQCSKSQGGWSDTNWVNQGMLSKNFESYKVYIIECFNDNEKFIKIGKTFLPIAERFHNIGTMPYKYNIIGIEESTNGKYICSRERELQALVDDLHYVPTLSFHGSQIECFNSKAINVLLNELGVSWLHIDVRQGDTVLLFTA